MRKSPNIAERICSKCGIPFKPNGNTQKYCSNCQKIRNRERGREWARKKYGYSERTKCNEVCCICGNAFHSHYKGKPYCSHHYNRLYRTGNVEKPNHITNTFELNDGVLKITTKTGQLILADSENYEMLSKHSWCVSKTGYAVATINKKVVKMHRYILGLSDASQVVDHMNHNKLDNRKSNLRICTSHENALSQRSSRKLPMGIRITKNQKYEARIFVDGKTICLGRHENIEDAIETRNKAEIKYRGEFAQHLH